MEEGPIMERKTTDVFFCIAFLGFWVFSVSLFLQATKKGDISKILRPSDGLHDCGIGETKNTPKMFINKDLFKVTTILAPKDIMIHTFCVKECPKNNTVWKESDCFIGKDDPRIGRLRARK